MSRKQLYLIMFYAIPFAKRKVGLSPFLSIEDLALKDLQNLTLLILKLTKPRRSSRPFKGFVRPSKAN